MIGIWKYASPDKLQVFRPYYGGQESRQTASLPPEEILQVLPADPIPLDELKNIKRAEIRAARDAACYAPVSALGHVFQADARSQELLGGVINLAQLPGFPLPTVWRSLDDVNVPISSLTDLVTIGGALAAQTQAAYAKSWQLKAAVDAATTNAEIEAIKW